MTRLWVERLAAGRLAVGGADYRYLARVLRLGPGAELTLFDGRGQEARARIADIDGSRGELVLEAEPPEARQATAAIAITLLVALLKAEKMDLVVQKATELGVARIVPVRAARSVVRLDAARATSRVARWRKIAREAARQCGRVGLPEVEEPRDLRDALVEAPEDAWKAIFFEGARASSLRAALPAKPAKAVVLAIGPEGGFEEAEVELAREAGFDVVGLGPRILRAETAALAALAAVGYALGDLA